MNAKLFCRLFAGMMLALLLAAPAQAQNKALDPVDRKDDWWVKRQAANVEKMEKGDIELLLIGDSITNGWDGQQELYEKTFGPYKPINMGFSGDQTAHVLWRLDHLPLDKISPKAAMIMIGTNNIGHTEGSTPKEAAEGIVAIVKKLQKQYPKLQIIVLKVFPRDEKPDGNYRKKVNEINAALPAMLKGLRNVSLVDINAGFLDKDGTLPKSIMGDFLHPGKEGYEYWAKEVAPYIAKAFRQYNQRRSAANRMQFPRLRSLFT
jgi:lysophospholipase L1-like esterase